MTELKQLRDFAEQVNGIRPQERSLKGVVNNLIQNYQPPIEVVANPELDGTEPFLRGLQVGKNKYDIGGKLDFFVSPFYNTENVFRALIPIITIKDYKTSNNVSNIGNIYVFIKDETTGTITKNKINTVYTSIRIGTITYCLNKGNNVRYVYFLFNAFLNNPDYSEHIISIWGTVEYKYIENDTQYSNIYSTEVCTYQLPVIESAKSGTKSSSNEIDEIEALGEESIGTTK